MEISNGWVTGFVDGDGCFTIQQIHTKNNKVLIRHRFIVSQDLRSVHVLYALKKKFKCGSVHKAGNTMMAFTVTDKKSIENIIIPFFIKNPLQTEKRKDFYKFVESVKNTTSKNLNGDLSRDEPLPRDKLQQQESFLQQQQNFSFSINDNWFAGFVDAEACFYVSIVKNYPRPQLIIGVSDKDKNLMIFLQKYLQCGHIRVRKDNFVVFTVSSSKDFQEKIFPKLITKTNRSLLKTIKRISFQKFRKIVLLILEKKHLHVSSHETILKLKLFINNYSLNHFN